MSSEDGPYVIEHGDVWFLRTASDPSRRDSRVVIGRDHVCGPHDKLALVYDTEDNILHKHGTAEFAGNWLKHARGKFREAGMDELADALTLVEFAPVPEAIAELNACISHSGRVGKFVERMQAILADHPEYGSLPNFPK